MMLTLAVISLCLSALACLTFLRNIRLYLPPPDTIEEPPVLVSVLIPARNEEFNIAIALQFICLDQSTNMEVIVGDDDSGDRTAEIVRQFASEDLRVSLLTIPPPPSKWNGKQHACHVLSQVAKGELLLFVDADVQLMPGSIPRMSAFLGSSGAQLISGVPRQICGTFLERLVLPLIHFVLLSYLPIQRMRNSLHPSYAAGCGQLFMVQKAAYSKAGGHAAIWNSMHDGINLPRTFRRAGLKTDLFDATHLARCRMYDGAAQVWKGLAKNAVEAMASPRLIGVFSVLLFGGQVLPFALVAAALFYHSMAVTLISSATVIAAWLPRLLSVRRFRQPLLSALLHPCGVVVLLAIQWHALICHMVGMPAIWKGRSYQTESGSQR